MKNAQQVRGSGQRNKGVLSGGEAQHTEDKVSSDGSSHVDVLFIYRHLLCNWRFHRNDTITVNCREKKKLDNLVADICVCVCVYVCVCLLP